MSGAGADPAIVLAVWEAVVGLGLCLTTFRWFKRGTT